MRSTGSVSRWLYLGVLALVLLGGMTLALPGVPGRRPLVDSVNASPAPLRTVTPIHNRQVVVLHRSDWRLS